MPRPIPRYPAPAHTHGGSVVTGLKRHRTTAVHAHSAVVRQIMNAERITNMRGKLLFLATSIERTTQPSLGRYPVDDERQRNKEQAAHELCPPVEVHHEHE